MAIYRSERNIDPKDIAPRKEKQYTRTERWAPVDRPAAKENR